LPYNTHAEEDTLIEKSEIKSKFVETVKQDPSVLIKRVYNTVVTRSRRFRIKLGIPNEINFNGNFFLGGGKDSMGAFLPLKGIAIYVNHDRTSVFNPYRVLRLTHRGIITKKSYLKISSFWEIKKNIFIPLFFYDPQCHELFAL
jgi:hypothetical protein